MNLEPGICYKAGMRKTVPIPILILVLVLLFSGLPSRAQEDRTPTWKERWAENVFDRVDLNDDGSISKSEAARSRGIGTKTNVVVPYELVDGDHDGRISKKEFVDAVKKSQKLEFYAEDHDSDLGMAYRPKAGRDNTQNIGLKFKF